ncbi:MAG: hypothetical protein KDD40_01825, partial [Bdellovibrionales bacterium]|nr:hypothetical protein [Bdellovibrionales bacterium]
MNIKKIIKNLILLFVMTNSIPALAWGPFDIKWWGDRTGTGQLVNELSGEAARKRTAEARAEVSRIESEINITRAQIAVEQNSLNVENDNLGKKIAAFSRLKEDLKRHTEEIIFSSQESLNKAAVSQTNNLKLQKLHAEFTIQAGEIITSLQTLHSTSHSTNQPLFDSLDGQVALKLWSEAIASSHLYNVLDAENQERVDILTSLIDNNEQSFYNVYNKSLNSVREAV